MSAEVHIQGHENIDQLRVGPRALTNIIQHISHISKRKQDIDLYLLCFE